MPGRFEKREQASQSEVAVRALQKKDLPEILRWFQHPLVKEHFAKIPQNVDELALNYDADNHGFVAEDETGQLVGVLTFRDNLSASRRNGYMERVAVKPELQGKGVGTKMLRQAIAAAFNPQGLNYYKITLGVVVGVDGWERTKHVYEKLGFRVGGVWRNHVVTGARIVSPGERIKPEPRTIQRKLSDGHIELIQVRDAIWMDLLQSEWKTTNSKSQTR